MPQTHQIHFINRYESRKNCHDNAMVEISADHIYSHVREDKHLYNPPIQSTAGIPGPLIISVPLFCARMKSFTAESPKSSQSTCNGLGESYE